MCDLRRIVQNVTFFVQLSMNGVFFKKIVCFLYSNGLKKQFANLFSLKIKSSEKQIEITFL